MESLVESTNEPAIQLVGTHKAIPIVKILKHFHACWYVASVLSFLCVPSLFPRKLCSTILRYSTQRINI